MGYIAMKALAGGLILNAAAAAAWMAQFDHVLPIWGIQRERELEEFLAFIDEPPAMTPALEAVIAKDRQELVGDFCRGCGYCMPCPQGIEINQCARMSLMMRRPLPHRISPRIGSRRWQKFPPACTAANAPPNVRITWIPRRCWQKTTPITRRSWPERSASHELF